MENKLTKEEVLHVARLARIGLSEEDIEKYQVQLKQLLDDVDKIKYIKNNDEEILIVPVDHVSPMRNDEVGTMMSIGDVMKNAPRNNDNYVEVPVMISE